jgi:hypothetical protein
MKTQESNLGNASRTKNLDVTLGNTQKKSRATIISLLARLKWIYPLAFVAVLYSCNDKQLVLQYKDLHQHDSLLMVQTMANDSTIKGYINNMNDIQSNLDEIKSREKILTVKGENGGNSAVEDIKAIDKLMIKSNREVAALRLKMKQMNVKDAGMETMITRMTAQLGEKDSEIATLQGNLARVNNSYTEVTRQFNDSITVLQEQNARISDMINSMNTVYYAIGTEKELKTNKVITETGGFIGLGKNTVLTPDNNTAYFTKTDLTKLNVIPLNAKFRKLLTAHPVASYKITGDKKADSLVITDPSAFWSEDKYLVIAVK